MRFFNFIILIGIMASAWAGYEYLGDLGQDKESLEKAEQAQLIARLNSEAIDGNIQSQFEFARHSILTDQKLAATWMERAARSGHVKAQYYFASMLETGSGIDRNYKTAVLWYRRSATIGNNEDAQYALGRLYNTGVGVGHDPNEAVVWFKRSAQGGHAAAQFMAGRMFETGWGGKLDLIQSFVWYTLSNKQRSEAMEIAPGNDPQEALARINKTMNDSQRSKAKEILERGLPF